MHHNDMSREAVIIGGGIAGLLAARAVCDHYDIVTIVDKDLDVDTALPRKGVPQGHHIHVLLNRGEQILENFFPGFRRHLQEAGSVNATLGKDVNWFLAGRWVPEFDKGMVTFFQTQPLLEKTIRDHVKKIPNVRFLYGWRFTGYGIDELNETITSATIENLVSKESRTLSAEIFIDARGRGNNLPDQLEKIGYPAPEETRVGVDFAYSSGLIELPEEVDRDWKALLIYPKAPHETRGAAIIPVEGGKWMVTAAGYNGDHPPTNFDKFITFSKLLPQADIYNALKKAKLIGSLRQFRFKEGVRRRFESLTRFPKGLLVIGDGICSANPFFGQGISVAAMEAEILSKILKDIGAGEFVANAKYSRRFFDQAAEILDISWDLATGEDLKYPQTTGQRPFGFGFRGWLKDRLMSSKNPDIARQFYRVMHFVDKPTTLFRPKILLSALLGLDR